MAEILDRPSWWASYREWALQRITAVVSGWCGYVCTRGPSNTPAFGGEIYLMSFDGQTTTPLVYADSTGTLDNGIPKAHFGDIKDIYFSIDRTGGPQVYVVTGFG